ncbi:MAG TPA: NmrA/HSCARG family protein [Haliangium sp.]|nr:NmrA/HSCARG family protein [Haliangium sp.]
MNVLVTGATGKQGGAVARALLAKGHQVRAATRDPESEAAQLLARGGARLVEADFRKRDSLIAAMRGTDAIFAMTTFFEEGVDAEIEQGKALVEAAGAAGVPYVVYTSVAGADQKTGIPHFDSKYEVEKHLQASGLAYAVVAPVYFMENVYFPQALDALRQGVYAAALPGDRQLEQIAVEDIGNFAALVIEQRDRFAGQRIDIASDELDGNEQADILSEVLGRPIRYQEVPLDALRQQSEEMALMYEWFDRVGYDADILALRETYPEVGWHTFEDWVRKQDWQAALR